jgi:hypothetical protein
VSAGPSGSEATSDTDEATRRSETFLEALENERGELLRSALTVASSRTWRLAWRLSRWGRRLTLRRAGSRSELDLLIERLVNLELRSQPGEREWAQIAARVKEPVRGRIEVIVWGARSAQELEGTLEHLRRTGVRSLRIITSGDPHGWDEAAGAVDITAPPETGPRTLTAAADAALGTTEAELVVLLRAGLRVPADWLERLRRAASSGGHVAMVATLSDAGVMPLRITERPGWLTTDAVSLLAGGDPAERLRVSVLDGGCFALVPRRLMAVGGLDPLVDDLPAAAVDLASRLNQHGGACVLADDVLVHETRDDGAGAGRRRSRGRLRAAHGSRRHLRSGVRSMLELERSITTVASDPVRFGETVAVTGRRLLRSVWVLPTEHVQGRAHILGAAADISGMRQLGLPAQLAVPAQVTQQLPQDDRESAAVFENEQQLESLVRSCDVVVAVGFEALPAVRRAQALSPGTVGACVLRALPRTSPDEKLDGILVMAPSRWLAERVEERFAIPVEQFVLSADSRYFHPTPDEPTAETRLQIAAWLRPGTVSLTIDVLGRLAESLPRGASLVTFGASLAALERRDAPEGSWRERHLGALSPGRLAQLLGQTDILIDLTKDLPTGELAAAAMACGAIPVVDATSGAAEIIEDGRDGLVVTSPDPADWHDVVAALDQDWPRLRSLQTAALQSATRRSPLLTAVSQYTLFERAKRRQRSRLARAQAAS